MSFIIHWENFNKETTDLIKNIIQDQFKNIQRPNFLGELKIDTFDFGDNPPKIEINNVTEPFEQFYQLDPNEEEAFYDYFGSKDYESNNSSTIVNSEIENNSSFYLRSERAFQNSLDLDVDSDVEDNNDDENDLVINEAPIPSHSRAFSNIYSNNFSTLPSRKKNIISSPKRIKPNNLHSKSDSDIQFVFNLEYDGNMNFGINTELIVNYPTINFISLPIKLKVTSFSFSCI